MISFSQTGGTSGTTQITISATSNNELVNIINNYTLSNQNNNSLLMPIIQKAYKPETKYIEISPSTISFASSGGNNSITIKSNDNWVVESDEWIMLSNSNNNVLSGNGNTIIGISCYENIGEARTGAITAYCQSDSSITATTTISQSGEYVNPYIILGYYSLSIGSSSASTAVSVSSNTSWSAITDSRWIYINTTGGTGNGNVSFSVAENETDIERDGMIQVFNESQELSAILYITQSASTLKSYIFLSPYSFNVAASGSSGNAIAISANCDYEISSDVPWITLSATGGSGNGSVSFATSVNSGATDVGNIEFSNSALSRTVSVEREGIKKYLSASTDTISVSSSGGDFEVYVYSNTNWSVMVDEGEGVMDEHWMSVSPSSGTNNGSIRVSVSSGDSVVSGTVLLSSLEY